VERPFSFQEAHMTKYAKRGSRADATNDLDAPIEPFVPPPFVPRTPRAPRSTVEPITEPVDLKLIEVELARKYCPVYCYEAAEGGGLALALDDDGKASPQAKVVIGEKLDKFNKTVPVYREIFDTYPAGTVIPLPEQEGKRALRENIARITDRTFDR
jgi:hypothetical protein